MNIFEQASREQLRFTTARGLISTEDLWSAPLTSKTGYDLDSIAKEANAQSKAAGEESFVVTKPNPTKALADLRLEIVKHVIAVRLKENEEKQTRAARQAEKARLLEVLESKQDDKIRAMTDDEIKARIAEIEREA